MFLVADGGGREWAVVGSGVVLVASRKTGWAALGSRQNTHTRTAGKQGMAGLANRVSVFE